MSLDELIEMFKRAAETASGYPSKESLGEAICVIEADKKLLDYLHGALFLLQLPEWVEIKSGLQNTSFVETVKSAKILYARLTDFRDSGGSLNANVETPPV